MPDQPGNPTPEEVMEEKMAELKKMQEDLTADRQRLDSERANNTALNDTIAGLTTALEQSNQPAPEPEPELEGDPDADTLRAAVQLSKQQLKTYHAEITPYLASLAAGQFESEWERAKASDPKNFARMERVMREKFDKNPELKQPGAVETLFSQMKGQHYNKLQEMDRADRQKEIDNVDPNPTNDSTVKVKDKVDVLTEDEWKFIKGLGRDNNGEPHVNPEHYYLSKHGRYPDFPDKYLEDRGYEKVQREA